MKVISNIEMANDSNIYDVGLGAELTIIDSKDGFFEVYESDECVCDNAKSHQDAKQWAQKYATDDGDLVISGYGTHSGRKFWQLPDKLQIEALKIAGFNV